MESKNFVAGFILRASERGRDKGYHPIIYIEGYSDTDFVGAMITHSAMGGINVEMDKEHFQVGNDVVYDNSYLVKGQFIKPSEWGPFDKVGELTEDGLIFVKDQISECQIETFNSYYQRMKEKSAF